jgi:hypothetical protein
MGKYTAKALLGTFGCVAVGVACYATASGDSLWGLILVTVLVSNVE